MYLLTELSREELLERIVTQFKIKLPTQNVAEPTTEGGSSSQTRTIGLRERLLARHMPTAARFARDNTIEGELHRFQDVRDIYDDVLVFWSKHSNSYPNLAAIARVLFCLQATTATAESAFSFAGLVIRSQRAKIDPYRVEKVLFIHDNYDLFNMSE